MQKLFKLTFVSAVVFTSFVLSTMTGKFDLSRKYSSPKELKMALEKLHEAGERLEFMEGKKEEIGEAEGQDHPDLFAQYEHDIRTPEGKAHPEYPVNYQIKELMKAKGVRSTLTLKKAFIKVGNRHWIERGPGNVSGRTRGIVVDPDDPTASTWYVGSVGGGVWKTTDAGNSWINLTPELPNLATSTIAMAASNHDVMYVGTGEGYYNVDEIDGTGIWKTTDRGKTWRQLPATLDRNKFRNIMRIVVDPNDENLVLVASGISFNGGTDASQILRSTDGGETWATVLNAGSNTITQIVPAPSNFNVLYATITAVGVYKSFNGGKTWYKKSNGLTHVGRMELAVSPVDPQRVYISAEGGIKGATFYYSKDGGENWTGINPKYNWLGGQGWYDNTIAADPYDINVCYVGGINLWRITLTGDNSIQQEVITDGYGQYGGWDKGVHVDHHNIVLVKTDTSAHMFRLVNANDGGVSYSDDKGKSFVQPHNGYNTTQFYGVDKRNGADEYIGGMQDNSCWRSPSGISADSLSHWSFQWGGDGFQVAWHYNDPNKILASSQFNSIGRSLDGGKTYQYITGTVRDVGSDRAPFFTKIAKSNQDPDLIFIVGSSGVWRSSDFGSTWRLIKLTGGDYGGTSSFGQLEISLADPQIIWVGNNLRKGGGMFVSRNGGFNFEKTNGYELRNLQRITGFTTDPIDSKTALVTFSYAKLPKILKTTDLGKTWTDISGFGENDSSSAGFPDVAVYDALIMPYDRNVIWAGTEIGIFETTDGGAKWHFLDSNLPAVAVYQMKIVNDQVVIATHGRGVWSLTMPELAGYEPKPVKLAPVLSEVNYSLTGVTYRISLRDVYDSTHVLADSIVLGTIFNSSPTDTVVTVPFKPDESGKVNFSVVSFDGEREIRTESFPITVYVVKDPITSYASDFSEDDGLFIGDGFSIKREFGFRGDIAIHSKHPYENNKTITYTLIRPIIIADSNAFLNYKDIAIVEPGEAGSEFGDPTFYDYVIVEGSKDGVNWKPFADGYDARYDSAWLDVYNNGGRVFDLYVEHKLNMLDTFNAGDTVLIRFRLFADAEENGWGWAIDNLEIQKHLTAVEEKNLAPSKFALLQNYPNPFNPSTTISYSIPTFNGKQSLNVTLNVYNTLGQKVATLVNKAQAQGNYSVQFNANNLPSGVYFYRLRAGNFVATKKMVLLK